MEQSARVDQTARAAQPLVLAVSGLPGAGCTTMAAALTACFGVVAVDVGSDLTSDEAGGRAPDLLVRVIGAQARARDAATIAAASVPVIVVAGKRDTRARALSFAAAAATDLRCPVYPVSGLLAAARLGVEDVALLRGWQQSGVSVPAAAAAFAADDCPQRDRARMLALLGRAGLVAALRHVAAAPEATPADVTAALHRASGIDDLVSPITAAADQVVAGRRARRLSEARLLAARGPHRAAAERRLMEVALS